MAGIGVAGTVVDMTRFEVWTLWLQGLTILATVATVVVLFWQVRGISAQLAAMNRATAAESALAIVEFLQHADVREARSVVRAVLSQKHHASWDDGEKQHASAVCANYDVVAALLKSNIASLDFFINGWGPSICHCHQVLSPFITVTRSANGSDSAYWSNFDWLAAEASKAKISRSA